MARAFLDTNVLFYALDCADGAKQQRASELIAKMLQTDEGVISIQVVHEFLNNLIRKLGKSPEEALEQCAALEELNFSPSSYETVRQALLIMKGTSVSYWDACILASASQGGCKILYTEDLNHGQTIAGVRIVNPFL